MQPRSKPSASPATTPNSTRRPAARRTKLAPFTTDDPRLAWEHFRDEAQCVDVAKLPVCNADVDLVRTNVNRGVAAVMPLADKARADLPNANVTRALEAPALALALTHACDRAATHEVVRTDEPPSLDEGLSLSERTSKMFADRALLLGQLKVFMGLGDFPAKAMADLLEGSGPIDGARDVLAADAALDGEKLRGRHPFSAEWRERATQRARRLLGELSPTDATPAATERNVAAIERDAYWSLLVDAHAELRKIGMVLFGERELDEKVPPLNTRVAKRKASSDPEPTPKPA